MKVQILGTVLPLLAGVVTASAAPLDQPLTLGLPIDCEFGKTCFIQQYFDHDPGPGAKDYRCGPMSYDDHDGVDLRVPTLAAQKKGVAVLAAAAGTVRGARDGMEDVNVAIAGSDSVKGRECGNGVVIAHAGGWETQYCHMAKGSVRVRTGQQLGAGATLGLVGMSGNAEFPHLHFSVRHNGDKIDPFAADAAPNACGGKSLWSREAAAALSYHSLELINFGFVPQALTMADVESGHADELSSQLAVGSPALIAFVRAIGLKGGDVQILTLRGPDGQTIATSETPAVPRDRAQQLLAIGKRRAANEWPRGTYEAEYDVRRDGAPFFSRRFSLTLR